MFRLLTMPFRGLYYIVIGILMSSPLLALGAVLGLDMLVPMVGPILVNQFTGYTMQIKGKTTISLKENTLRFEDVTLTNPTTCETADFLHIANVTIQVESLNPLQKTWHAKRCEIDIDRLVLVYSKPQTIPLKGQNTPGKTINPPILLQNASNLDVFLQKLRQHLPDQSKPITIDVFVLKFNGLLTICDYRSGTLVPLRRERMVHYQNTFRDVHDPLKVLQDVLVGAAKMATKQ
jgi:hypothetical protein